VTSVAEGLEPRIHADFDPPSSPTSHHGPRGRGSRCAFGHPPRFPWRSSITRRGRLERPQPTAHRLDRYPWDLRERTAHRVGCGGAFRSGWDIRVRPLDGPTYGW